MTIAALLVVLVLGAGVGRAAGFQDPAQALRTTTLRNGLTVLTLVDRSTPVVSLQMWVKVGSKDETRYTGIAHLFEHMMFKGSLNIPPEEHARLLEARGGRVNAYTTNDVTVFHEDVTPDTLPLAIDLEAERVANLDISERPSRASARSCSRSAGFAPRTIPRDGSSRRSSRSPLSPIPTVGR